MYHTAGLSRNLGGMLSIELNVLGEVAPQGHGLLGVEEGTEGCLSHVCAQSSISLIKQFWLWVIYTKPYTPCRHPQQSNEYEHMLVADWHFLGSTLLCNSVCVQASINGPQGLFVMDNGTSGMGLDIASQQFTVAGCLCLQGLEGRRGLYLRCASTAAGLLNYLHTAVAHKASVCLAFLMAGM
jgi:hypothetical protein